MTCAAPRVLSLLSALLSGRELLLAGLLLRLAR
jgi:hypothetical protein